MKENKTISQADFARMVGKTPQYISLVVNRRVPPVDVRMISNVMFVELTQKTLSWIDHKIAQNIAKQNKTVL